MTATIHTVETAHGPGRWHRWDPPATLTGTGAAGTLVLGHGAGGGVAAADLQAMTMLSARGWVVALLEQPWRVAGRRIAVAPPRLDEAAHQMLNATADSLPQPWVLGGRSAGARVACRLFARAQALCLIGFPLQPPGRGQRQPASRLPELLAPLRHGTPVLVLQGERDHFATPAQIRRAVGDQWDGAGTEPDLRVIGYTGDHSPSTCPDALRHQVGSFLERFARPEPTTRSS